MIWIVLAYLFCCALQSGRMVVHMATVSGVIRARNLETILAGQGYEGAYHKEWMAQRAFTWRFWVSPHQQWPPHSKLVQHGLIDEARRRIHI